MNISNISSSAYWLTSQPRNTGQQAESSEMIATQSSPQTSKANVTIISARTAARQNVPTETDGATKAALLAAQEVASTSSATNIEPTPWETAGYSSRREWLLSGEYVPEGMEGKDHYIVYAAPDNVPEDIRLKREQEMQFQFENPTLRYEERISNLQQQLAMQIQNQEYFTETFGYENIQGKQTIEHTKEQIAAAEKELEAAKIRAAETMDNLKSGPVFNIGMSGEELMQGGWGLSENAGLADGIRAMAKHYNTYI